MAKGQMRNLETFKIGSGQVNEFEYQKNQGRLTEQSEHHPDEAGLDAKPLTRAERVKQIMAAAHEKVEKKRKKAAARGSNQQSKALKSQATTAKASAQKVATGNLQTGKKKKK